MFSKSNLLATIAGTIAIFILGYLIWGMALNSTMAAHTMADVSKEQPDMLIIFIANLVMALGLSTLYGKWARGTHSAKEGFQFGALIGIFAFGVAILWYGTSNLMDLTGTIIEGVADMLFYGIICSIIAMTYKLTTKTA